MSSSRPNTTRASGSTQEQEVTKAESEANDSADEKDEDPARSMDSPRSRFRTLGLSRMKFSWSGEDGATVAQAQHAVDERIKASFADAFAVMHDLYLLVREPEVDTPTGEIRTDAHGYPIWKRTLSGGYVEDWSALSHKQRENFLFSITTRLFAWETVAANAWGEAMFAKAAWEETFSIGYSEALSGTIDDRTAAGRKAAAEDRYFAIFLTMFSKRADAIVRVMTMLGQRLKDTTASS